MGYTRSKTELKQTTFFLPEGVKYLNISITNNCNFICSYCYKKNEAGKAATNMNLASLHKLLKYLNDLQDSGKYPPTVFISGGEPMIVWKTVLVKIIDKYLNIKFQIATNGSIKVDNFVNKIKRRDISWILSYDGIKCNQRQGFSNDIFESNIEILTKNNFHVHLNPTYNHANLENMVNIYFREVENKNDNITYGWNLAKNYLMTDEVKKKYAEDLYSSMKTILDDIKKRNYSYIPHFIKGLIGLKVSGKIFPHCQHKYRMIVDVFENIYPCNIISQDKNNRCGTVRDGVNPSYDEWIPVIKEGLKLSDVEEHISKYAKKLFCGLKCNLFPKAYTILNDVIEEFYKGCTSKCG